MGDKPSCHVWYVWLREGTFKDIYINIYICIIITFKNLRLSTVILLVTQHKWTPTKGSASTGGVGSTKRPELRLDASKHMDRSGSMSDCLWFLFAYLASLSRLTWSTHSMHHNVSCRFQFFTRYLELWSWAMHIFTHMLDGFVETRLHYVTVFALRMFFYIGWYLSLLTPFVADMCLFINMVLRHWFPMFPQYLVKRSGRFLRSDSLDHVDPNNHTPNGEHQKARLDL